MKHIKSISSYEEMLNESYIDKFPIPDDPSILYISTEIVDSIKSKYKALLEDMFNDIHKEYNINDGDNPRGSKLNIDEMLDKYKRKSTKFTVIDTAVVNVTSNMAIKSLSKLHSDKINMKVLSELHSDTNFVNGDDIILVTTNPSNKSHSPLIKVVLGKFESSSLGGPHSYMICTTGVGDQYIFNFPNESDGTILVVNRETYEDFAGPLNL